MDMNISNSHSEYPPELRAWMRAENIDVDDIRGMSVRKGWHDEIVDFATANMPNARDAQAREVHRRKIAAMLAWSLITFIIVSFAIALLAVWVSIVISIFALLGAGAAIAALGILYRIERARYGR
jgi:1,4-dihydroxy-2-naphthoate octaprenyltransferase